MQGREQKLALVRRGAVRLFAVLALAGVLSSAAAAESWISYGRDARHDALAAGPSQPPQTIRWFTKVDLDPQFSGDDLYIHYGSPVITAKNIVLVPVKTGAEGGFAVHAFHGANGRQIWSFTTDYVLPPHNWTPPMGITLTRKDTRVIIPGAGGTIWVRKSPDNVRAPVTRLAFFGHKNYAENPKDFNNAIQICTPITSDESGNLFFGYLSSGAALPGYPNGIPSGLARLDLTGAGSYVAASTLANDNNIHKVVYNCAPALTADASKLYVAVNQSSYSSGYLCQVDSTTSAPISRIPLKDPRNSGWNASLPDDGTASPTIGPDGDVYFGVLEANFPSNHARGWMLHFDSGLTTVKTPGAFGWDDSASIVPATVLGSNYTGSSSYLILTKYNNYADPGIGGNGENMVAVLDPNATMQDPITGATVMNAVATVLGPTQNPNLPGVDEWCINSAAIDTANQCAVINSEDGHVYRWSLATVPPSLTAVLDLAPPTGEAYTSTLIGPDGAVYAINRAQLFCCVANSDVKTGTGVMGLERLADFFTSGVGVAIGIVILAAFSAYWALARWRTASLPSTWTDATAGAKA